MRKLKLTMKIILVLTILTLYYSYEYTSMYLWFHSSNNLIEKIKMNEDINFLATLPSLDDDNDHEYDKFLLEILKQKEKYNVNMCSKCGGTITSYANDILNQKYPGNNIPYFINFEDMSEITDKNISEEKLQIIKNISNDASLERWKKIIK